MKAPPEWVVSDMYYRGHYVIARLLNTFRWLIPIALHLRVWKDAEERVLRSWEDDR